MTENQSEFLSIVVKIESVIPVVVEAFRHRKKAENWEKYLRKNMHPENDEGVFPTSRSEVGKPGCWLYRSARNYISGDDCVLKVKLLQML